MGTFRSENIIAVDASFRVAEFAIVKAGISASTNDVLATSAGLGIAW
ncbi:YadA-like family protein [Salmonella enterica]